MKKYNTLIKKGRNFFDKRFNIEICNTYMLGDNYLEDNYLILSGVFLNVNFAKNDGIVRLYGEIIK